jgi:diguanylate cyclase (GGDEF)-like protein
VTLVLWDPEHEIRHLLLGAKVRLEDHPGVFYTDDLDSYLADTSNLRKPVLGPYVFERHCKLFKNDTTLASVALIPLRHHDRALGLLSFGSAEGTRFTRQLGTEFLAHLGVIASFALENAVNRARLVRSGLTDFLTGWHNRRYLHERLKEELSRAHREQTAVTCVLLDLDHFKDINDTHGHMAGDVALREAAARINQQIRGSDAAARFGGDEFVVLVPAVLQEQANALAERMRLAVCSTPLELPGGSQHQLTVSVGVALMSMPSGSVDIKSAADQLLAEADAALYRAKQKGRNRVEFVVC